MSENIWDQRYSGQDYAYGTEPNGFLMQHAGRLPVGDTLCLGEGEGRNAVYLAGMGHRVTALDASPVGLGKAQKLALEKGVGIKSLCSDLANYEFEAEHWDVIVSIFCHTPKVIRERVHQQILAALKPGGIFILEAYTPDQLAYGTGGPPVADLMMDLPSLHQELRGLEIRHGVEVLRDIVEGRFHNGTGAVVQVIAHKPGA